MEQPIYTLERGLELRHLRYFIAVAEGGSFRSAAERVHVTQPAITRQIHDLESRIGVALFLRTTTGVQLTAAGALFLKESRAALSQLHAAVCTARRVADGLEGSVRIGFVENAIWDGPVPRALARYQTQAPGVHLELQPLNTPEQVDLIMADRLDGGFIYALGDGSFSLVTQPVAYRGAVLAVPSQWEWPQAQTVRAGELNGKPLILFPRHTYPAYYDYLLDTCHQAGLTLNVIQEVGTEAAILSLVSAGIGAAIVNAGNRSRPPERVRFHDFEDLPLSIPLAFAYRRDNVNPALARFMRVLAASTDGDPPGERTEA